MNHLTYHLLSTCFVKELNGIEFVTRRDDNPQGGGGAGSADIGTQHNANVIFILCPCCPYPPSLNTQTAEERIYEHLWEPRMDVAASTCNTKAAAAYGRLGGRTSINNNNKLPSNLLANGCEVWIRIGTEGGLPPPPFILAKGSRHTCGERNVHMEMF